MPFKSPDNLQSAPDPAIGGKAAGLVRLHAAAAPVPPWVLLPPDASPDESALRALWDQLAPQGEGLAVRSSGRAEDGVHASAAGIYDTRFCDRQEDLAGAIAAVRASAVAARADAYAGGRPPAAMAVILQRRITPTLSGVLFSAQPARARVDRACIECVHGHGGALVDGSATPTRLEVDRDTFVVLQAAPGADGPQSLDENFIARLVYWLDAIEEDFDGPVDIEWAVDSEGLWLLQARPVTRLTLDPALRPPEPVTAWFFDQRFHEPIHPITRTSLLPRILRVALEEALELRGMTVPDPLTYDYGGQIYVPLEAYHRLLGNLPRWLLTPDLRQLYPAGTRPVRWPGPGLLRAGLPVLWRERGPILANIRRWHAFRDQLGTRLAAIPVADPADPIAWNAAWDGLDRLTDEFLRLHRWSIVLADYGFNLFRLVTRLLPANLRARVRARCQGRIQLVTAEANALRERALADGGSAVDLLCRTCGHRSSSLDYAAPTWAEEFGDGPSDALEVPIHPSGGGILVRLLEMREEQRFHWERILARQRALLRAAAAWLHGRGHLAAPDDIWWITWEELQAGLAGGALPEPSVIARRKRAHRIHRAMRRPLHLVPDSASALPSGALTTLLQGTGASPGRVRGRAVVCERLADLPQVLPQDAILVLPCLDPAWTPILRQVAGLVVERGGLLSHAAIIAREYGLPLVIGVPEATEQLTNDVQIEVDGEAGTVQRLPQKK